MSEPVGEFRSMVYEELWRENADLRAAIAELKALTYETAIAKAWQEGFDAAEYMAKCWGHVDSWGYADEYPTNPYAQ